MTHYEFTSRRNKYKGSWNETVPSAIDLPFTADSMKTVLTCGTSSHESLYTHQDIAHWCDRFHMSMFDTVTDKAMDIATGIAADVDAQWDMYLANSYSLEQLKSLDFSKEPVPVHWFDEWLRQLEEA